jgi:hypothetical protein
MPLYNPPSSSGTTIKSIEVNFGSVPTRSETFIITDSSVTSSSKIVIVQSGTAPTGKSSDENELDPILFSAIPESGQFILIGSSKDGPVVGNFKVNYMVG